MSDKPIRIWLVEDNPGDVYLFREALQRAELNFDMVAIEDGAEALTLIRLKETSRRGPVPDVVVLDLNLPKADGIEVLEALRKSKDFSNVPVVATSSFISPSDRAGMEHLRVARYFIKPSDPEAFFQVATALKEVLPARPRSTTA